jgi:hypothetical protein
MNLNNCWVTLIFFFHGNFHGKWIYSGVGAFSTNQNGSQHSTTRRAFVAGLVGTASAINILSTSRIEPANAAYGSSASLELPSYIDFLIEKSKTIDNDSFVYQGADRETQLARLAKAAKRLKEIPAIAAEKKWSAITGILTGPLGELIAQMTQISGDSTEAKAAAKKVKADLYAIGAAASKKREAGCIEGTSAASIDLEVFVKLAF